MISVFLVNFFMPKNPLSCCSAIVIAAPPMNPTIAACERKSIKNPNLYRKYLSAKYLDASKISSWEIIEICYLRIPRVACVIPAKKVAVKASLRYTSGLATGSTSSCRRVPSSSDTTATGPMAISLELPIKA